MFVGTPLLISKLRYQFFTVIVNLSEYKIKITSNQLNL